MKVSRRPSRRARPPEPETNHKLILWDKAAFLARVEARVDQLGKPAQTLLKDAGSNRGDEIRKLGESKVSPGINTIMIIAKALDWTIAQALGDQDPTLSAPPDRDLDPRKLMVASVFVEEHAGHNQSAGHAFYEAVGLLYSALSDFEKEGGSIDPLDPSVIPLLRRVLQTRR